MSRGGSTLCSGVSKSTASLSLFSIIQYTPELLVPRLRRAAATPGPSQADNWGHSKECLTTQRSVLLGIIILLYINWINVINPTVIKFSIMKTSHKVMFEPQSYYGKPQSELTH